MRLAEDYKLFTSLGCEILSPVDLDFVEERDGFVVAEHERDLDPAAIETSHLKAMEAADIVWLHAPDGYVGPSAAMELGFARAAGIRVFGRAAPSDPVFAAFVTLAESPMDVVDSVSAGRGDAPAHALLALQTYYGRVATERGYGGESAQDCMLLLTEEVGELARAVRKHVGLLRDPGYEDTNDIAAELADIQLYLLHLANVLTVDLASAVTLKGRVNSERFADRQEARAA